MKAPTSESPTPREVIDAHVNPLVIGKYYLSLSLAKLWSQEIDEQTETHIQDVVNEMSDETVWRMVEAFSVTRGLNDVFSFLTNESYTWSQEEWDVGALRLTGMSPSIDKVMREETIDRNPIAFRDRLQAYFTAHPDDDPEGLEELRPSNRPIRYPTLLLRDYKGQPALLDGSHRLIEMLLQREVVVMAYVGRGDNDAPTRKGPSIFRTLRQLYERTEDEAVLQTVRRLMEQSTDGRQWVQTYWIDHVHDEAIQEKGRQLLNEGDSSI